METIFQEITSTKILQSAVKLVSEFLVLLPMTTGLFQYTKDPKARDFTF